jgi:PA14 domain-containing protein
VEDPKHLENVRSGNVDEIKLPPGLDDDYFALRYTGKIEIEKADRYTFFLDSDDGSLLLIDGTVVVNNDGRHTRKKLSGSIDLTAGSHDIEVHYFEYFGFNVLNLSWARPGSKESMVPASALSSLKYYYYKGDWSYLPFNDTIATSEVVAVRLPKPPVESPANGEP